MTEFGLTQPFGFGHGYQHPTTATDPAAGFPFQVILDSRYRWRHVTCVFTLTTDDNAADRYVTVEYLAANGNSQVVSAAAVTVSASSTQRFCGDVKRGVSEWATHTDVLFPLSSVLMDGGGALQVNVAGIQAADQLSLMQFVFERFPTDPDFHPGRSD